MKGSFKTALIAAVVSAFVAAGAAVATTKTFVLGTTNTVDAASAVTAGSGLNTKLLQLTNNSTGSSATALGLTTASSRPPMIVSSQARVANLNADKLDGIDSGGFVRGRATFLANRVGLASDTQKLLLTIPGLGEFSAQCSSALGPIIRWVNTTAGPVDTWSDWGVTSFTYTSVPSGGSVHATQRTLVLGVGNDPGQRRTAVFHLVGFGAGLNQPCVLQGQGTLWTS
jgi:hypothetical protein